jgi:hypothetical protein
MYKVACTGTSRLFKWSSLHSIFLFYFYSTASALSESYVYIKRAPMITYVLPINQVIPVGLYVTDVFSKRKTPYGFRRQATVDYTGWSIWNVTENTVIYIQIFYWALILRSEKYKINSLYRQRCGQSRNHGSILCRAKDFSALHSAHTDSEAHPASYPLGTGGSFTGVKAAGACSWPLTSN